MKYCVNVYVTVTLLNTSCLYNFSYEREDNFKKAEA